MSGNELDRRESGSPRYQARCSADIGPPGAPHLANVARRDPAYARGVDSRDRASTRRGSAFCGECVGRVPRRNAVRFAVPRNQAASAGQDPSSAGEST